MTRKSTFRRPGSVAPRLTLLEDRLAPAAFSASGNDAASIQAVVDDFRAALGANNGVGGSFSSGRREINWDATPAAFSAPNNLPADFFNSKSPRGAVFSTVGAGTGFMVSGASTDSGTGQPALQFSNLNAAYPTLFEPFSAERLFTPVGNNQMDVSFFIPGTKTPARVAGFGVVFSDVNNTGNGTNIQIFDAQDQPLGFQAALPVLGDGTFHFVGVTTDSGEATIARVRITTGNTVVGGVEAGNNDVVVMDDFIYGEPIANLAPLINDIPDQAVPFGGFSSVVPFFVADTDSAAADLTVSAVSANTSLVSDAGIVFGGSGTNRTLVVAPNAGQSGTALITVTVTDTFGAKAQDTFTVTVDAPPPLPTPPANVTVHEAAGADAASIQCAVDAFRTLLGTNNGVGGPVFSGGRREINWDGVPAAKENPFPGDFFNVNSARGVVLSTNGERLQVSGDVNTPGFEFADVTAQSWGPIEFSSFSSPRLFAPIGSNTYDVEFRLPGTSIPAGVRAFGTVFTDVDLANVTRLEFFDAKGTLLLARDVLPTGVLHEGLSFLGVQLPTGQLAARVRVTTGSAPIDSHFAFPPPDGVAVDDFIYSEPQALPAEVVTDLFAVGSGPGAESQVNVFNADGSFRFALVPFGAFRGGVNVATGDVNGDGFDDIAAAAGPGGGPHVRIFDGVTGAEISSFFAFDPAFRGGVSIGLGDVTGDLRADIATGAGPGGGPHVKVFDAQSQATLHSFFAYAPNFRGGVSVRAGDVNGDGFADIVTGSGPGGGPHIKVFSGRDISILQSFFAGDPNSRAGVFVGVANLRGDAAVEVVGSVSGQIISRGFIEQDNLVTRTHPSVAPLPVAAVRFNGIIAILIGAAPGTGSTVNIVDGTSNTLLSTFPAFQPSFNSGVFVG